MTADNPERAADGPPAIDPPPRRRSWRAWAAGLALAALVCLAVAGSWMLFHPRPPVSAPARKGAERPLPPDPRLSYAGPFHNVHPDVAYVGDAACVECHRDIARTYGEHPMGRSLVPIARIAAEQLYDKAHNNPFTAFDIVYRVERQGDRVSHHQTRLDADGEPIYDFADEVAYVIGSGTRGYSYLTLREDFVFQTPISWFGQKQIWDLSPGFSPWARTGRAVQGACLFCHVNRIEPVENTRNCYRAPVFRGHAIGCERCHGPGELHVRTLKKDDIVDPGRLGLALREAVCQQCHLQGATRVLRRGRGLNDYRPGMPLKEFLTVYVRGPGRGEEHRAVNHVEQMYQSLCFRRSSAEGKMGCITCHNPHEAVPPARRDAHYRDRCLRCHQTHGCALPEPARRKKQPADSCIACHMPRSASSDIVHTAATDHRILRTPDAAQADRPGGPGDNVPLVDFHRGRPDLNDPEQARDLGVALYQLTLRGVPLTGADGEFGIRLLSAALREYPTDLDAWEAKGKLLQTLRRPAEAVEALQSLLERAPRHEGALVTLGVIHRHQGQTDAALDCWRRAVEVNPWVAEYRKNLVLLLAQRNAWEELRPHCRKWLELDPASVEARGVWVQYLLHSGRKTEAAAEFARIRALRPPNLDKLNAWFAEQTR